MPWSNVVYAVFLIDAVAGGERLGVRSRGEALEMTT
jgi:hypothetical protein